MFVMNVYAYSLITAKIKGSHSLILKNSNTGIFISKEN